MKFVSSSALASSSKGLAMLALASLLSLSSLTLIGAAEELHSCACEADELGFVIDCEATQPMLTALSALLADGCASDCSSEACTKNWLIVQSHHDYCPEAGLPAEIEDSFHDYDTVCEPCEIGRKPVDGLPDCPAISDCMDGSGNLAYTSLIADGCLTNGCDATVCQENYFRLKAVHDNCPHDALTREAEGGIHDLEDTCVLANVNCNSGKDATLVCDDHDHDHDHDHDGDSALPNMSAAVTKYGAILFVAAIALL